MAILAKTEFEPREFVPEGNYFGVCVGVYDIGTQPSDKYTPTHKVILQFELHRKKGICRGRDQKPITISGFYPLAFGQNQKTKQKSKLRQAVEGILGRTFSDAESRAGYDITQLLEKGCRLKIAHDKNEKGESLYDYIDTFMPLDEDDPTPQSESNCVVYELDPTTEIPAEVPVWVRKQIEKSQEWLKTHAAGQISPVKFSNATPNNRVIDKDGRDLTDQVELDEDDTPF